MRAVADDGHVVGNGQHGVVRELDLYGMVIPAVRPGITIFGPVVRVLLLAALLVKALLEQAELVPKAIAGQRQVAGGGAVQEAGGKSAQTAVAQSGVLDVLQHGQVYALGGKELLHLVQNAQVVQVGVNQPANQVFSGEVVGLPLLQTGLLAAAPVVGNGHHDGLTQSLMQFLRGGFLQGDVVGVFQLCLGPFEDVCAVVTHVHAPIQNTASAVRFQNNRG